MNDQFIITDCPEALKGFTETSGRNIWKPIDLPNDIRQTWLAVGGLDKARIVHRPTSTSTPWKQILAVGHSAVSQVDGLRALLQAGGKVSTPLACLALTGDNFHGNRGRLWYALEGNLHLTVLLSPN
ncbi:MAG: hypothetical protein VX704_08750, partial [Verrucomicrobiota bacterium]|nr:hypothetical protein [Verrucomicrobiota bacterium]